MTIAVRKILEEVRTLNGQERVQLRVLLSPLLKSARVKPQPPQARVLSRIRRRKFSPAKWGLQDSTALMREDRAR